MLKVCNSGLRITYIKMDRELHKDLTEILEGINPVDLLHHDPTLAEVAKEMYNIFDVGGQPVVIDEKTPPPSEDSCSPLQSSPEHLTESSENSNSGFELANYSTISARGVTKPKAKCEVCGRLAGGHLNYGALTCNSCRAFFFRSSKNSVYANFTCISADIDYTKLCKINSVSWRSCKKCRFQRCQELGMKVKGKNAYDVNGNSSLHMVGEGLRIALTLTDKLTNDERAFIRSMVIKRLDCKVEQRAKFLMRDPKYFRIKLNQTYHGQAIGLKDYKLFEDFIVYGKLQTFADGEFSGDGMTRKDRVKLLGTNLPLANEFREAYRIGMGKLKEFDPFKNLANLFQDMSLKDKDQCYGIRNEVTQNGKVKAKRLE